MDMREEEREIDRGRRRLEPERKKEEKREEEEKRGS